ncbi:hypothetical protein [Psychromonas sp. SP041]|uniref:hypothetical protein n=1 Tax=Psychromonas sp. SP041 TaxID=1365007 RepID=UPI00040C49AF|nr:hypothetical protein [Psychromonas sp. SP041]
MHSSAALQFNSNLLKQVPLTEEVSSYGHTGQFGSNVFYTIEESSFPQGEVTYESHNEEVFVFANINDMLAYHFTDSNVPCRYQINIGYRDEEGNPIIDSAHASAEYDPLDDGPDIFSKEKYIFTNER